MIADCSGHTESEVSFSVSQVPMREVYEGLTKKGLVYLVWFVSGLVSSLEEGSGRSRPCLLFRVGKRGRGRVAANLGLSGV